MSPPRINVKILPTTRRHALARAAVTLTADFETVQLGDFLLFRNAHDDVEVVMPEAVRVNYNLGKRIEAEVLAAYEQWAIKQQAGARP